MAELPATMGCPVARGSKMERLYRSDVDRVIGGVCGGLAAYLHIDSLVVRIAFVLLAMVNAVGLAVYLLLWVLVPARKAETDATQDIWQERDGTSGQRVPTGSTDIQQAPVGGKAPAGSSQSQRQQHLLIAGAALVGIGLLVLLDNLGILWWFSLNKLWPLLLIALGSVILMNNLKGRH
jgi:phage shock protein C